MFPETDWEVEMDPNRKLWNQQQQVLQRALVSSSENQAAIDLFLSQHAMVHSARMAQSGLWSFEDEILQSMTNDVIRRIPLHGEHSIAWIIWHMARVEDVTMNLLVAGCPQVLDQEDWLERMNSPIRHTGNAMAMEEIAHLSAAIEVDALKEYRLVVGRRTREIVQQLPPAAFKQKVQPSRLQQVRDEGAVPDAASDILDYWGGRTIAGLLLMPATRHNFLHLNEALRIKQKQHWSEFQIS
jgi:hypothetical protein